MPRDLARVLAWAHEHVHEPTSLVALARIAGVPPRTLETHFARFLGTTPMEWVRQERLTRARAALLASEGRASVSDVSSASGFSQLGRFAAQYCRRFGELPSETIRRLRRSRPDALEDVDDEATRLVWRSMQPAYAVAPPAFVSGLRRFAAPNIAPPASDPTTDSVTIRTDVFTCSLQ